MREQFCHTVRRQNPKDSNLNGIPWRPTITFPFSNNSYLFVSTLDLLHRCQWQAIAAFWIWGDKWWADYDLSAPRPKFKVEACTLIVTSLFIPSVVCLTQGPQPLPKRVLRAGTKRFGFQFPAPSRILNITQQLLILIFLRSSQTTQQVIKIRASNKTLTLRNLVIHDFYPNLPLAWILTKSLQSYNEMENRLRNVKFCQIF